MERNGIVSGLQQPVAIRDEETERFARLAPIIFDIGSQIEIAPPEQDERIILHSIGVESHHHVIGRTDRPPIRSEPDRRAGCHQERSHSQGSVFSLHDDEVLPFRSIIRDGNLGSAVDKWSDQLAARRSYEANAPR